MILETKGFQDIQDNDDDDLNYEFDDYTYDDEIGEKFAKELEVILNELLENSGIVAENFTSLEGLRYHFRKHCLARIPNRKSDTHNVFYDFNDNSKYAQYEKTITDRVNSTDYNIGSMYDYELILKCLRRLFEGNVCITFCRSCGLKKDGKPIILSILSFASNATTNYLKNTLDICVKAKNGRTITLYPVDAHYFQNKLNNIITTYGNYTGDRIEFNND